MTGRRQNAGWIVSGASALVLASAPASANNAPEARDVTFEVEEDGLLQDVLEATDVDNDPLKYRVVKAAKNGEATVTDDGKLTYRPKKDWHGKDELRFEVSDGKAKSTYKATFNVSEVNDAPTAGPAVSLSGKEDSPVRGQVTGSDIDGDRVTFVVGRRPRNGSVEVDERSGRFTFTPAADFHGTAKFALEVTDGRLSAEVPVTIQLAPTNDPPTTTDETVRGREDSSVRGQVRGSDPDGDVVTYSIATPPENGKVEMDAQKGSFVYTPAPNFNGGDEFEFFVSDGKERAKGHVGVKISAVNDPPKTERTSATTREDEVLTAKINASDPDADALSFSLSVKPRKGEVVLERGTGKFTYTPIPDFHGKDKFSVDVGDGNVAFPTWVNIEVTSVNDPPEATSDVVEGKEDTPITGKLQAQDVDGQPLTFKLSRAPKHGEVTVAADGAFRYVPKADTFGEDAFQFEVTDGAATARGDMIVSVQPVNDAPVAADITISTREDSAGRGQVNASDIDRDKLSWSLGKPAGKGVATVDANRGAVTYTPNKDENGEDAFSVLVSDGKSRTEAAVKVTIAPVNDAPVAQGGENQGAEDQPITGVLVAADVDQDKLAFSVATAPRFGKVTIDESSGGYTYEPKANYNGEDTFRFQVSDGSLRAQETIKLVVTPVNDAPEVSAVSVTTAEDSVVRGRVAASDIDGDTLTWTLASKSTRGTLEIDENRGTFVYRPNENANGDDTVSIAVSDGKAETRAAVNVAVTPVNDAPVAQAGEASGREDEPIKGALVASDIDADPLSWSVVGKPRGGSVNVDAGTGTFTYQPGVDFNGTDAFTFQATDGKLRATAEMKLTVAAVNDTPVAKDVTASTAEDKAVSGAVTASDVDKDKLSWTLQKRSQKGKVSVDAERGTFVYTPNENENGEDSFSVQVSDGAAHTEATVAVVIAPVNDAPLASDHTNAGDEDTPITGRVQGSDVDPDTLAYSVATAPRSGKLTLDGASGAYTYAPATDFHGDDAFRFRVSDGKLAAIGEVKLSVASVNDVPVAQADVVRATEDRAANGRVTASDVDRDTLTFRVKTPPTKGEVVLNDASGAFTYTSSQDVNGDDEMVVEVTDGFAVATATVKIAIAAADDPPIVDPRPVESKEDEEVVVPLRAIDPDGDSVTFRVVKESRLGTARIEADGRTLRFTPHADVVGEDALELEATDGRNRVRAVVPVRIAPQNDLPIVDAVTTKTPEETATVIALVAHDKDGDATRLAITSRPKGATVKLDGNLLTVTPALDRVGPLELAVAASDAAGQGPPTTIVVEVINVNDTPVAKDLRLSTSAGTAVSGTIAATDADDGDELTFSVAVPPARGRVTMDDSRAGRFTFAPAADAKGEESFRIRVKDRSGASTTATVLVAIR